MSGTYTPPDSAEYGDIPEDGGAGMREWLEFLAFLYPPGSVSFPCPGCAKALAFRGCGIGHWGTFICDCGTATDFGAGGPCASNTP